MVQQTLLPNGLMVISDPLSHVDTVALNLTCFAGSRHEAGFEAGIAHFLEHMVFKGTQRRNAYDISYAIESVGADMNAFTSREQTSFHARLLPNDMPLLLDIFSDMLFHSLFDETEGLKESKVITQEILQGYDTPDDYVFDLFQEAIFGHNTPLGTSIAGTLDSVASITMDSIRTFRNAHYHGGNMVLIASGAVEHDAFVHLATQYFGFLSAKKRTPTASSLYGVGSLHVHHWRADSNQMPMLLGYAAPSSVADTYIPACLLAGILGGGMSSRLFQEIRENHGLAYTISSYVQGYSDTGVFTIYTGCDAVDAPKALDLIHPILKDACENLVSSDALNTAKAQLRFSILSSMENPDSRAGRIASHCRLFGHVKPIETVLASIDATTPLDIRIIAAEIFSSAPALATIGSLKTFEAPAFFRTPLVF